MGFINFGEVENPVKKVAIVILFLYLAHLFLYQIFNPPRFIDPVFKMGQLINSVF